MKRDNRIILMSLFIIPLIFGVVFVDLAGVFSFSDMPFAIAFILYILFVIIQHPKSNVSFTLALSLLIWMGLSYIPTGAGIVTERIGEWFYLFLVFGLVQSARETRLL